MKRFLSVLCLTILIASVLTAAAPLPNTTFTLVGPTELLVLNDPQAPTPTLTMNVGETLTVEVEVNSDVQFLFAQALPSFQYVGKGVVAVQGGDHVGSGTSATLSITYKAKSPTSKMPDGVAPVHMVVGVRYPGGYVAVQDYLFNVTVP
ncbi:MAG TPA: hypothetical protein VK249_11410 [Anaerolineales bacterium]|nr:hypothetical protein [Anaerolineales bacterium]